ncbi:MAG: C45 family peptidase [Bacteroidales bacterium]|jgi:tetratricopeptide (TPR) repeat protein|nr:C45 family peptidase [Bacteroidales bacterium]
MRLRFTFLFALCFLLRGELFAQPYHYEIAANGKRIFQKGELVIKEGVPFLTVKGEPYEAGLQYGVLLNDYLLRMDHTIDSLVEHYIGDFFLKKWIANAALGFKIRKFEKRMPEDFVREFEGMAEGSDLSLKEIKTLAYFPQLFFKISCSAFILKNEKQLVHGRNLDWPGIEVLTQFPLLVNYHIDGQKPFTNLTFIGYPGVYTGMNHAGLSMSINMNSAPAENGKEIDEYNTGMPLAFKVRDILQKAETLDQVDGQFKGYRSHAWFITVGSKSDFSGAIYELTRGRVIKNEMHNDFLAVANLSLSDVGRYQYSPASMFNQSNISRERKLEALHQSISNADLISKSYQILTNTENHHMSHNPFYSNCINNSITVKSCIMDNIHHHVYFTYGERCAARNKYLKVDINTGMVSVFREKQPLPDEDFFQQRVQYQQWYKEKYAGKELNPEDYRKIIKKIQQAALEPAYQYYLLSWYFLQLENYEKAFEYAEKYIAEKPDFYHPYRHKYAVMKEKNDYHGAIVALEEMLQTPTVTPDDIYFATIRMIKMYDKLQEVNPDPIYIRKINTLADKIRYELTQYFKDDKTLEDLEWIEKLELKYAKEKE